MVGLLPNIPFYCIHLEREEGRLELIRSLEDGLGRPLVMWPASEGSEVETRLASSASTPRTDKGW